jgi:hypothetical protein
MLVENQNEVEVLSASEVASCSKIAKAVHGAWSSGLKRDEFINKASDELIELTGTQPDYEFHKAVQGQTIQHLINLGLAVDSANTYYGYILKQAIAKHNFVKPSKNTKDSARMSESRKAFAEKFEHVSVENILADLKEVNEVIAQDLLNGVDAKKADIEKQKELTKARDLKNKDIASDMKANQKGNIDKLRAKIESFLKVDSGRVNQKGNPIFEWSIVNLDFAYRCFERKEEVKKFLASLK